MNNDRFEQIAIHPKVIELNGIDVTIGKYRDLQNNNRIVHTFTIDSKIHTFAGMKRYFDNNFPNKNIIDNFWLYYKELKKVC